MSGFVFDKGSSLPLGGALVTVIGNKATSPTTTDSDGAFTVTFAKGVEAGDTVRIRIEKSGYKTYDKLLPVSSEVPERFLLEPAKMVDGTRPAEAPNVVVSQLPGI